MIHWNPMELQCLSFSNMWLIASFFKTRATNISGQNLRVSIFHSQSLNAHDEPQAGRHVEGNQGSQ
jgi:hypothetical protein